MIRKVKSLEELKRDYFEKDNVLYEFPDFLSVGFTQDMQKYCGCIIEINEHNIFEKYAYSEWMLEPVHYEVSEDIGLKCNELKEFLLHKNKNYGNSALNPTKIFSKLDSNNSIKIRIDDKINRIMNSQELRENDIVDLAGYLVLLCVDMKIDFKKYME